MIDILKIAGMSKLMQFNHDEVIIQGNAQAHDHMYAVLAGNAIEYSGYSHKDKGEKIAEYAYGDCFGEIGLFADMQSPTTIVAVDSVTLVAIDKNSFCSICAQAPESAYELIAEVTDKLVKANNSANQYKCIADMALAKLGTNMTEFSKQTLFPIMHKAVDMKEPDTFADFLSPYNMVCPSCKNKFESKTVLTSKLRPANDEQQRADMRKKYINFEPIWYDVTSCPHCLFSAQTAYFSKSFDLAKSMYLSKLEDIKLKVNPDFTLPKTLEQVFISYYIALICSEGMENTSQVKGRLWLQLSWLYDDINQPEMVKYAREQAYEFYLDFYSISVLDVASTQACCLILGSLAGQLDLYEEAMAHLYKVKSQRDGKPIYKLLAERESDIIREEHKAKTAK